MGCVGSMCVGLWVTWVEISMWVAWVHKIFGGHGVGQNFDVASQSNGVFQKNNMGLNV